MNKLKQNGFWALCAVLVGLLVAFGALKLLPLWTELGTSQLSIKDYQRTLSTDLIAEVPSRADVDAWIEKRKVYGDDLNAITGFYTQKDEALEKWFPALGPVPRGSVPGWSQFSSPYFDNRDDLEKMLAAAGVQIGIPLRATEGLGEGEPKTLLGFNWPDPNEISKWSSLPAADQNRLVQALQKRFWIATHVANACAPAENGKTEALVLRLVDLDFFESLGTSSRPSTSAALPPYVGGPSSGSFEKFPESALPDGFGTTITFGVAVELPFENVSMFMRHILDTRSILVNITGCRLFTALQNEIALECTRKIDPKENRAEVEKRLREAEEKKIAPAPATLWLTCQAIDFKQERAAAIHDDAQ